MQCDQQQPSAVGGGGHLSISALNHISRVCSDVQASTDFYVDVLGFVPIKRPSSLEQSFDGAWLFKHGLGVHLIEGPPPRRSAEIDPKSDHISFVADDLEAVAAQLQQRGMPYVRQLVEEHGVQVQQLFFHDPDRNMIEICNCHVLPVMPLAGPQELARCHTCADAARELQEEARRARKSLPAACAACWASGRLASGALPSVCLEEGSSEEEEEGGCEGGAMAVDCPGSCLAVGPRDFSRDSMESCREGLSPSAAARLRGH